LPTGLDADFVKWTHSCCIEPLFSTKHAGLLLTIGSYSAFSNLFCFRSYFSTQFYIYILNINCSDHAMKQGASSLLRMLNLLIYLD